MIRAQSPAIGQWSSHISYRNMQFVEASGSLVFGATNQGVVVYNQSDNSISSLNRTNFLNDVNITAIKYDSLSQSLIIGYINGSIDVFKNGNAVNLPDIKRSTINGDKSIRAIYIRQNLAYLATGIGIVVFDLDKKEIRDTYKFGPLGSSISVKDITVHENQLYAATEQGVYAANLDNTFLGNYENWTKQSGFSNDNGAFNNIEIFNNTPYVNYHPETANSDEVYSLANNTWTRLTNIPTARFKSIRVSADRLVLSASDRIFSINTNNELLETVVVPAGAVSLVANDAVFHAGSYWVADGNKGLINTTNGNALSVYLPDSPLNNQIYKLFASKAGLYVATGSVNQIYNNQNLREGILHYDQGHWSYMDETTDDSLKTPADFLSVTADPTISNRIYVSSWSAGLIQIDNNRVSQIYNMRNSAIQQVTGWVDNYRIATSTFDKAGNLWVGNSFAPNSVVLKTPENKWRSYKMGDDYGNADQTTVSQILVAADNTKWLIRHRNGLYAFNDHGTYDELTDDSFKSLTNSPDQGGLPSNEIYCIAEDLDGEIWMGSDQGFAILYNPSAVFDGNPINADQPIIEQDGNYEKVLAQEAILSIAVDGGNRKWMATQNSGVYLLSEDGTKQILHFTSENSPLLSNEVYSVTIHPLTGEVFFGTSLGIQSYMSDAIDPAEHIETISVFPNPVRPGFVGSIALRGFVSNTNVKITDIAGNLVFQTASLGGEALWDGKNFKGEKVASGVYLIFATNLTGEEKAVGKLLYLN